MGQAANGLLSGNKDLAAQWTNQMSGWNNCRREKVQENSRLNVTANRAERVSGTQGVRPITKILTRKSENVYPVLQVFLRRSRAVWNRILSTRIGFSPTRNQWIRSPKAHRFETVPQSSLRPHPHEPGKKKYAVSGMFELVWTWPKPIALLTFSLPSTSSLLELPSDKIKDRGHGIANENRGYALETRLLSSELPLKLFIC